MKRGIKNKINLVNDISGLSHDVNTIKILKDTNIPFRDTSHLRCSKNNAR